MDRFPKLKILALQISKHPQLENGAVPAGQSKPASAHQAVSHEISNDEEAEPVSMSHLQCFQQLLMYILNLQIAQLH